ncbi:MAG: RNA polymerase sigma factor [Prevotellaceae bacterium]|jgi:RNA polymerase sigma-70 factor (ECF subfamily)|nr:RNA polymerase sigma factor [Prevotellaceae bacterium]
MTKKEYNTCVDEYADGVYRFMLSSIKDVEKARDLVQDAFEKLWRKHDEVQPEKGKSFLFTIAYHAMIDMVRKEKRMGQMSEANLNTLYHTKQYSDLNEVLHQAIQRLPTEQRMVILLRDYEGYSYGEIGEIAGLTESQVKVYIFRGRQFLKSYIGSISTVI